MGLLGDVEHGFEDVVHAGAQGVSDVVHAGESAFEKLASMLDALRDVITGAGLGSAVKELEQLADEANALRGRLESAVDSTKWAGSAADAFKQRAQQRGQQISALVKAIDEAHGAVAAADAAAGII
jgi:uncharacterized protein YukE